MAGSYRRLRLIQIRTLARLLNNLSRVRLFRLVIQRIVDIGAARSLCNLLLGYRRPFTTFAEATAIAQSFLPSHEFEGNIRDHLTRGERARPSDYAALFHIRGLINEVTTVLDVGGNAGNLFYCYSQYQRFPDQLRWIVYDLPITVAAGERIALERSESRLVFTSVLNVLEHVDLLLISGSLHYFEEPLSQLIAALPGKPTHILINRTPLVASGSTYTVQDAGTHLVSCKVRSADSVRSDLSAAGYTLVDQWEALELSLTIPLFPEFSAPSYTGMYWRYNPESAN